MIIKAPTGQYVKNLPQSDDEAGSITYTISNQVPPPVILTEAVIAPESVRFTDPIPDLVNRNDYGELIFTVVNGASTNIGSNKKLYEPGEVIDFNDDAPVSSIITNIKLTLQHNLNLMDLTNLGLSDAEISAIEADSLAKMNELQTQYNTIQSSINNTNSSIVENQKAINEARKALRAVEVIYGTTENDIYDKLSDKLTALLQYRDELNDQLTTLEASVGDVRDNLINLVSVVK